MADKSLLPIDELGWFDLANYPRSQLRKPDLRLWTRLVKSRVELSYQLSKKPSHARKSIKQLVDAPMSFEPVPKLRFVAPSDETDTGSVRLLTVGQIAAMHKAAEGVGAKDEDRYDRVVRHLGGALVRNVHVDLSATRAQIKKDFTRWLGLQYTASSEPSEKKYDAKVLLWYDNFYLPYFDMDLYARAHGYKGVEAKAACKKLGLDWPDVTKSIGKAKRSLTVFSPKTLAALQAEAGGW